MDGQKIKLEEMKTKQYKRKFAVFSRQAGRTD